MTFKNNVGWQLGVFIGPYHARWSKNMQSERGKHPCDSNSKYRNCWGGYCQCKANEKRRGE